MSDIKVPITPDWGKNTCSITENIAEAARSIMGCRGAVLCMTVEPKIAGRTLCGRDAPDWYRVTGREEWVTCPGCLAVLANRDLREVARG